MPFLWPENTESATCLNAEEKGKKNNNDKGRKGKINEMPADEYLKTPYPS